MAGSDLSGGQIGFRRITDPLQVPVSSSAGQFLIPEGYIPTDANAFLIVNPNLFWMRLRGSGQYGQGEYAPVTGTDGQGTGWLFPPGFVGVFTTQFPRFLSTMSVSKQGIAAGSGFMEIAWGMGVW